MTEQREVEFKALVGCDICGKAMTGAVGFGYKDLVQVVGHPKCITDAPPVSRKSFVRPNTGDSHE